MLVVLVWGIFFLKQKCAFLCILGLRSSRTMDIKVGPAPGFLNHKNASPPHPRTDLFQNISKEDESIHFLL